MQTSGLAYRFTKRAIDLLLAVPLLVLTLPLQLIMAAMIRLDSPGPAVFRQRRIGLNMRDFTFFKFRTMYADAASRCPNLYDYRQLIASGGAAPLKQPVDPRLTRVGRWLRTTSLDELPNLVNVIRGEMSLVGPRPEVPELLELYSERQRSVFRVKPGLTGLPQVSGRNRLTVAETIELDLKYAQSAGLGTDFKILAMTMVALWGCRDAY